MRVVYFNRLANGEAWLLFMYAKAELDSVAGEVLREIPDSASRNLRYCLGCPCASFKSGNKDGGHHQKRHKL